MIIAIDFDGTIVENKYPKIGTLRKGAKAVINRLYDSGHFIIIYTCLLYTSPSPRDLSTSRMPSSA